MVLEINQPRRNGHARRHLVNSMTKTPDPPSYQDRRKSQVAVIAIAVYRREFCDIVETSPFFFRICPQKQDNLDVTPAAERLRTAVLQVQWQMAIEQTEGSAPSASDWEVLVGLGQPRIRNAVEAAGVTGADVDDCIQDTWVEVLKSIENLHPASNGPGIACWLQTIARRTAVRFRRRQARFLYDCEALCAHQACQDPDQLDPANICIERETQRQLVHSIDLLRNDMGERTHLVVTRYLAGETNLTSLAKTLGISRGRLFHSWRTAMRFLHNDLV